MTARKGQDWGAAGGSPDVVVATDEEAGALVDAARRQGQEPPVVGLTGGDLWRTLGGREGGSRLDGPDVVTLQVDIGRAQVDDQSKWFVAHCVARRPAWTGPSLAVMNAAFLGSWNLAPRAHPNDGRLDAIEADLSWSDRWKARRRLPSGTHVPHPDIRQRRITDGSWEFSRPVTIRLDGRVEWRSNTLEIAVEPDALTVVI
ncbi:MAG: hypothetical protein ACR2QE_20480 [Acidimicrobiales bacterium]